MGDLNWIFISRDEYHEMRNSVSRLGEPARVLYKRPQFLLFTNIAKYPRLKMRTFLHRYSHQLLSFSSSTSNFIKARSALRCSTKAKSAAEERHVPEHIPKPEYYYKFMNPGSTLGDPEIKSKDQIHRMRASCRLAARILQSCESVVKEGNTTDDIDAFVHAKIIENDAYPSPLRYAGFPKSVCTSVNDVACHGIPDERRLEDGDIINVDITVFLNGYHGDCSRTFMIGDVDADGRYLVESTAECLDKCIALCGPSVPFNAIGRFITKYCKEKRLGIIPAFIGHGIGSYFHGPPEILHYKNYLPGEMQPGMTFTIEPILTLGGPEIEVLEDGWTAVSVDGERSAQFENTVLITENGAEVLTKVE